MIVFQKNPTRIFFVILEEYKNFWGIFPHRCLNGNNCSIVRSISNVTTYCLFHSICRYIQTHKGTCIHVFFYPWHTLPHVYTDYRSLLQCSSTPNVIPFGNLATHINKQSMLISCLNSGILLFVRRVRLVYAKLDVDANKTTAFRVSGRSLYLYFFLSEFVFRSAVNNG